MRSGFVFPADSKLKKLLTLIISVFLVSCLIACGNIKENEGRKFTDDLGREVILPGVIENFIPTGPEAQIFLYTVCPDRFAAVSSDWSRKTPCIFDEEFLKLPVVGKVLDPSSCNIEEIAAIAPSVIIDIGENRSAKTGELDNLERLTGIPVIHFDVTLFTMGELYIKLGELLGEEDRCGRLSDFCNRIYEECSVVCDRVGDRKVSSLYITGEEGLCVLANGSYMSEIVDLFTDNLAVIDNPAGKGTGNEATLEQILIWNPEVIFFSEDCDCEKLISQKVWDSLDAVKNQNFVTVPEKPWNYLGMPPSSQRLLGMIWLSHILYPEYVTSDMEEEIEEFYDLFLGYDICREELTEIDCLNR